MTSQRNTPTHALHRQMPLAMALTLALACTGAGLAACAGDGPSVSPQNEHRSAAATVASAHQTCPAGGALSCSPNIDLVLLNDLSGSSADDLPVLRRLASDLHESVIANNPGTRYGLASFIDKPLAPYGGGSDVVYHQDLALTDSASDFERALSGLFTRSGADSAESQLEALLLLARNALTMDFAEDSRRYVVVRTDAPFHVAGDCTTCAVSNDGDGVADIGEDYPSIAQVGAALREAKIVPIFAVGQDQLANYRKLADQLGIAGSQVLALESDSANLVQVITQGLSDSCSCQPIRVASSH